MTCKRFILIFSIFLNLISSIFSEERYCKLPAYTLIDPYQQNGLILKKNIHKDITPASLTKIMTAYITFEAIDKGLISIDQIVEREKYLKIKNLEELFGSFDQVDVEYLIAHLLVRSSNQAAEILANEIIQDEGKFIKIMNNKAKILKMYNTKFFDVSGLDERNVTTVSDMTILIKNINDKFKNFQHFFRMEFYSKNCKIYENRTNIFETQRNLIGFKTGHLNKSGYHLATWIKTKNHFYIAIITGAKNELERDGSMHDLLSKVKDE